MFDSVGDIIGWILFGLVAGAIARLLMPGRDPMGWIATILLGVAGSFIGGFLGRMLFGAGDAEGFSPAGWIGAIIGAILLLFLYRMFTSRQPRVG